MPIRSPWKRDQPAAAAQDIAKGLTRLLTVKAHGDLDYLDKKHEGELLLAEGIRDALIWVVNELKQEMSGL